MAWHIHLDPRLTAAQGRGMKTDKNHPALIGAMRLRQSRRGQTERPRWWGRAGMKASLLFGALSFTVAVAVATGQTAKPIREDGTRGMSPNPWVNPRVMKLPGVEHHTFPSKAMNCELGFNIYTPPDYADSDRRYPVIYWLHGAAAGGEAVGVGNAVILQKAIQEGKLPPVIMVFPNGGRGTFYDDSFDGTIMAETALIKELVPFIDAHYRTVAERRGRAIEGFSMGGFGALKFAFKYPDLFCSVVAGAPALLDWAAVSGSRRPNAAERAKQMWNNDRNAFESDHPSTWLEKNADRIRGRLRIRIVVGDEDGLKERYIDAFQKRLEELNIAHEYEVVPGVGHSRTRVYPLVGLKGFQFQAGSFARGVETKDQSGR